MYDAELTAVATGAASTLVAAIAASGAGKMRLKVAHFFRRATPDQQRAAAQAVDDTAAQLTSPSPDQEIRPYEELERLFRLEDVNTSC